MMHGVLEQTFYTVSSKKFYTFYLTKELVEESMKTAGVQAMYMDLASADGRLNASDLNALPLADLKDLFIRLWSGVSDSMKRKLIMIDRHHYKAVINFTK